MTDENLNVEETVEETVAAEDTISMEKYREMEATAEKYKGYFKKEKAKQKTTKADSSDMDMDSIKKEIMEEVSFYTNNPNANQFKDWISEYVDKWLTHDEAYRLVASKEDPSLLIDQQTKAKLEAPAKELTGVAETATGDIDYSSITPEEALKLPHEQQEKYWDYKKNG